MAVTRFCTRSYTQDRRIFPSPSAKIALGVFFFLAVTFPLYAGTHYVFLACVCGVSIISALGLNVLTGYTGLISLGHAAFMGIGAYSAALLSTRLNLPFIVAVPLAALISALAGVITAGPALRLRGLYLVVTTLAFQFIVQHVIFHWESLTLGDRGIALPTASLFGCELGTRASFYYVILALAILTAIVVKNLAMSRTGRAFVAVRDRDIAAEIIGVHTAKYKVISFATCSFIAGLAGALYAYLMGLISPDYFTLDRSILYIAMIIVGGMGTVLGSIVGAIFMTLLPEVINAAAEPFTSMYTNLAPRIGGVAASVYGLIIILFLLLEPNGLFGIWMRLKRYWKPWPFGY